MMKTNKVLALLVSAVMVIGSITACDKSGQDPSDTSDPSSSSEQTGTSATDTTAVPEDLPGYVERTVADVTDEDNGKIMIYGYNAEFSALAEKYAGITTNDYDFIETTDSVSYQEKLDAVFSDGVDAPDIFTCDEAYARKYLASDNTIALNDLGIDYAELTDMFDYTLRFAADDDNVIKGLAWKACPTGIFYERSLAEEYLGTQDPNQLAASFATWDAVLDSARTVNEASEGDVKLLAGYTETFDAYLSTREAGWIMDGTVNVDPNLEGFFDFAKTLYQEDLTFRAERWSGSWEDKMSNKSVVSYWGSLQFAKYELALNPGEGTAVNPTAGDWGITTAPVSYYSGGSWVMASKYCDKKATSADIIRAVCINADNLKDMVNNGEFVNNIKLMTSAAADDKFCLEWLGGQNPYPVLLDSAKNADASNVIVDEAEYSEAFMAVVGAYSEESFDEIKDALEAFEDQLSEKGLV